MVNKDFKSPDEVLHAFPDEQSCVDHLEALRWNGNIISPFDSSSKVYACKGNKYRCRITGRYFNVRTGTLFDGTKVDLRKWFLAIFLVTKQNFEISSFELATKIQVTQKTAWFMLRRIKNCYQGINNAMNPNLKLPI